MRGPAATQIHPYTRDDLPTPHINHKVAWENEKRAKRDAKMTARKVNRAQYREVIKKEVAMTPEESARRDRALKLNANKFARSGPKVSDLGSQRTQFPSSYF